MAQLYVYVNRTTETMEAIAGICTARPDKDYFRFAASRDALGGNNPDDVYKMDGERLVAKTEAEIVAGQAAKEKEDAVEVMVDAKKESLALAELSKQGVDTTAKEAKAQAKYDEAKDKYDALVAAEKG